MRHRSSRPELPLHPDRPIPTEIPREIASWGRQFRFHLLVFAFFVVFYAIYIPAMMWSGELLGDPIPWTTGLCAGVFAMGWPLMVGILALVKYIKLRKIVAYGHLTRGEVVRATLSNSREKLHLEYQWRGPRGGQHARDEWVRLPDGGGPQPEDYEEAWAAGASFPMLTNARWPEEALHPGFRGIELVEVGDARPARVEPASEPPAPPADLELRHRLMDAPQVLGGGWIERILSPAGPRPVGALTLEGTRLCVETRAGVAEVDLAEPFTLHLSFWPASAGRGEVALRVRQRGAPAAERGVSVRVLLPQARIAADVPEKMSSAPYLEGDPEALLEVLYYFAIAHGVEGLEGIGA